jgi:oligosaccharide repeat unit polymerase
MEITDIITIISCFFSILFLKKISNPINLFNPFVYFFWPFYIFSFFAILYRNKYTYTLSISSETIFFINAGLFFYLIGGYISFITSPNKKIDKINTEYQIQILQSTQTSKVIFFIFLTIPILFSIYFLSLTNEFLWLSDSFDDYRISLREGNGWIAIFGASSAYFAAIYSCIYFSKTKKILLNSSTIIILSISAIVYGNRAPALEILVIGGIFLCYKLFGKIRIYHAIIGFFFIMTILMTLGIIRQGLNFNSESLLKQILWRPFTNIQNLEWITKYFPSTHDFFYGESLLIDLAVCLPGYQPNFGTYIKELMGLYFTGGSLTLSFLGQAYIDFGYIFALILIFLFGFLLHRIYRKTVLNPKFGIFLIIFSIYAKSTVSSGLVSPFLYTFIPTILFLLVYTTIKSIILDTHKT